MLPPQMLMLRPLTLSPSYCFLCWMLQAPLLRLFLPLSPAQGAHKGERLSPQLPFPRHLVNFFENLIEPEGWKALGYYLAPPPLLILSTLQ